VPCEKSVRSHQPSPPLPFYRLVTGFLARPPPLLVVPLFLIRFSLTPAFSNPPSLRSRPRGLSDFPGVPHSPPPLNARKLPCCSSFVSVRSLHSLSLPPNQRQFSPEVQFSPTLWLPLPRDPLFDSLGLDIRTTPNEHSLRPFPTSRTNTRAQPSQKTSLLENVAPSASPSNPAPFFFDGFLIKASNT